MATLVCVIKNSELYLNKLTSVKNPDYSPNIILCICI